MSTTQSETRKGTAQSAQCGPHSDGDAPSGAQRAGRAGARESSGKPAQSQPDSADTATVTARDYFAEFVVWFRQTFTPPDLWSQDSPALKRVWAHAARGAWTTEAGVMRKAGQVYAFAVAIPVIAVCKVTEFVAERPSRGVAASVLLWLLSQVPPLAWLI